MKKTSFDAVKRNIETACDYLRSFTLAHRGFLPKHGLTGIKRVTAGCNRLDKLFGVGPKAAQTKSIVAIARGKVLAAKARLAILGVVV